MEYKHNHSIQFDLDHLTQHEVVSDLEEKKTELDRVYAMSSRVTNYLKDLEYLERNLDEHLAKIAAFDTYHSIISKHIEQQHSHNKHDMIKKFVKIHDEYESGERNEL